MDNTTFYLLVGAAVIIFLAGIAFLAYRSEAKRWGFAGEKNLNPVGGDGWSAEMGWRYVCYFEGTNEPVVLQIEPMARGEDLVYVPDAAKWLESAPDWTRAKRDEILERLKSVEWNRKLAWREGKNADFGGIGFIRGSLESTRGGRKLQDRRLFHPGGKVSQEEAHELWCDAARLFASSAIGEVIIAKRAQSVEGSVFEQIEMSALEINPNVKLTIKEFE
jgi:hypothetical protein